jgi:hypothetical protein
MVQAKIVETIGKLDSNYRSKNMEGFRVKFIKELKSFGQGRMVVGNSLFDSFVEEILMDFRNATVESVSKSNQRTTQSSTNLGKYTYATLPFTASEKQTILTKFTAKYMKGKSIQEAQKYIEEELAVANEQKQNEIIDLLKECYK